MAAESILESDGSARALSVIAHNTVLTMLGALLSRQPREEVQRKIEELQNAGAVPGIIGVTERDGNTWVGIYPFDPPGSLELLPFMAEERVQ